MPRPGCLSLCYFSESTAHAKVLGQSASLLRFPAMPQRWAIWFPAILVLLPLNEPSSPTQVLGATGNALEPRAPASGICLDYFP